MQYVRCSCTYKTTKIHRVQARVGDVWVGVVWACILIFVWLSGKIHVGEWCEVVGNCEVQLSCKVRLCYLCSLVEVDSGVLFYLV